MAKTKILYLYSEIVGYNIPIFEEFVDCYNAEVHVVHWDHKKLKPYLPKEVEGVTYYKRSLNSYNEILCLANRIKPHIIYISGWMDRDYLKVTKQFKKRGVPIITAFDDIWMGTIRQRIGALIFPFYFKKFFTHAWVAGPYQFEFARRLGFKREEIIFDMLSADTNTFEVDKSKQKLVPNFIYVGNFRLVKGTDILIKAFEIYKNKYSGKWNLIVVGNGDLENGFLNNADIKIFPFSSSDQIKEIAKGAGTFILPSRHDQWGVVVHEFTSLGLPVILSENVGAKAMFLIDGFNGYTFKTSDEEDLALKMVKISNLSYSELDRMGENSRLLSNRISVKSSAANFMSILVKTKII